MNCPYLALVDKIPIAVAVANENEYHDMDFRFVVDSSLSVLDICMCENM